MTTQEKRSHPQAAAEMRDARFLGLARVSIKLFKSILICSILFLMGLLVACGGSTQEPVSARVIVTNVEVSIDGDRVESITVRTDAGRELPMRLSDGIDPAAWAPAHLQGHQGLGELGVKIGVTYIQTSEGIIVTDLFE